MVSHRDSWARLGRDTAERLQLLRNLVTSLLKHERIMTTHPKAKAAQRMADRYIALARNDTPQNRSAVKGYVYDRDVAHKLFTDIAPRYQHRLNGFTRVVHVKRRERDDAPMSYLELVDREGELRQARPVNAESVARVAQLDAANRERLIEQMRYIPENAPPLGQRKQTQ